MTTSRFQVQLVQQTEEAAVAFVRNLDAQIDELQDQLQLMQGLRRATATTFGFDRRENTGRIGIMTDAANRANYEGEGEPFNQDGQLTTPKKAAAQ